MNEESVTYSTFSQCPSAWQLTQAADGLLARFRVWRDLSSGDLRLLARLATEHGDGYCYLTSRAGLQIRGITDAGAWQSALLASHLGEDLAPPITSGLSLGRGGGVLIDWAHASAEEAQAAERLAAVLAGFAGVVSPRFSACLDIGGSGFAHFVSDVIFRREDSRADHFAAWVAGKKIAPAVPLADIPQFTENLILERRGEISAAGGRLRGKSVDSLGSGDDGGWRSDGGGRGAGAVSLRPYWGRVPSRAGGEILVAAPPQARVGSDFLNELAEHIDELVDAHTDDTVKIYLLPWHAMAFVSMDEGALARLSEVCSEAGLDVSASEDKPRVFACRGSR